MPNIVPGAIWQPIDVAGRGARIKGRGAVGHVAVSSSPNLVPSGPVATRGADWHFYLPKAGNTNGSVRFFQYVDLDLQCWASEAGNATLPAWESEGGLGSEAEVNAEPWTENQLNAAAIIYAHLARTEGAPLQVMPDSRPSSRGLGAHRFGIDPWRVSGGEKWSDPGKLCPGTAKVAQLPEIISRAKALLNPAPTPAPIPEDSVKTYHNTDTGEVAQCAPGFWQHVPNPAYLKLLLARGLASQPIEDVNDAEFKWFRSFYGPAAAPAPAPAPAPVPPPAP